MRRDRVGVVVVAVLCIMSLALTAANLSVTGSGLAEEFGGETDPTIGDGPGQIGGYGEDLEDDSEEEGDESGSGGEGEPGGTGGNTTSGGGGNGTEGEEEGDGSGSGGAGGPGGIGGNGTSGGGGNWTEGEEERDKSGSDAAGGPGGNGTSSDEGDGEKEGEEEEGDKSGSDAAGETGGTGGNKTSDDGGGGELGADEENQEETPAGESGNGDNEDAAEEEDTQEKDNVQDDEEDTQDEEVEEEGDSENSQTSSGGYSDDDSVGGSVELSERKELIIDAPEQTKWRLGAYVTYTGQGWDRDSSQAEPVTGPLSTEGDGDPQPKYQVNVTTQRQFETLVTAWRPAHAYADREIYVDEQKALIVETPFEANDTYTTVTYGPPPRDEAQQATGDSYPSNIESKYTQLPDDIPNRLVRHTDEITANTSNPYEMAEEIQAWLQSEKEYSLDVNHNESGDIADEFVFEMNEGYCEYFATTMTVMLRTQDIPARYVTGYGPGEERDDGRYLLRGKNAHAWVEVYFEDVGWVPFDPTPSAGRLSAGRDAEPPNGEEEEESETEDEQDESETEDEQDEDGSSDTPEDEHLQAKDQGSVDITVESAPIPGKEITVRVTKDGSSVSGAAVSFNNESIGPTEGDGTVNADTPYAEELNVTVRPDSGGERYRTYDLETNISVSLSDNPVPGTALEVHADIDGIPVEGAHVTVGSSDETTDGQGVATIETPFVREAVVTVSKGDAEGSKRFLVLYDLVVDVADEAGAGTETNVSVTIGNEPVENAKVTVANESATTVAAGTASVVLPFEDKTTVVAERGEFSTEESVDMDSELNVTVDSLVVPGFETTVTVTNQGKPVADVPITISGVTVAATDEDGTAAFRPTTLGLHATIVAKRTETYGASGPHALWPYWLLYTVGGLGIAFVASWQAGLLGRGRHVPHQVAVALVTGAKRLDNVLRRSVLGMIDVAVRTVRFLRRTSVATRRWFHATRRDFIGTLTRSARQLYSWIRGLLGKIVTIFRAMRKPANWKAAFLYLTSVPARVKNWLWGGEEEDIPRAGDVQSIPNLDADSIRALSNHFEDEPTEEDIDYLRRILEAWEALEKTTGRRPELTPTELAERARRQGYPGKSIEELTQVFQVTRYGRRQATPAMAEKASRAAEALQQEAD